MAVRDSQGEQQGKGPDEQDREQRIQKLRQQAAEAVGGEMEDHVSADCPLEMQEAFWKNVVIWETAPITTHLELVRRRGVEIPAADLLDDDGLHQKLWEIVRELAQLHVFLVHTDHLGDRELYERLIDVLLLEETRDLPPESQWNCELDLLGEWSEQDFEIYYAYYADEHDRRAGWSDSEMGRPVPAKRPLPFDRDRRLPAPDQGP